MDVTIPPALDGLPLHRARTLAACEHAAADERVLGMCIGGSFAGGSPDVYSDVDLKLVVADDVYGDVAADLEGFAAAAGDVVASFRADHLGLPHLLIVLYDDLIHADFLVLRRFELRAESAEVPLVVLWERDGAVSAEIATVQEGTPVDVEWFERRIWTWLWYGQTKVLRGELYEALDMLGYIRDRVLFPLLSVTRGVKPSGSRRAESLTGELAARFADTVASLDASSALEALRATAELYVLLADPLLEGRGLRTEAEARRVVREALDAGLGWTP
jgi:hypothetical protein